MIYGYKNIWKVAGPILLGMVIQQLIGVTDVVFLGRVGQAELGASAIAGLYYITIYMLGVGFGVGVQILIARLNGADIITGLRRFLSGEGLMLGFAAAAIVVSYLLTPWGAAASDQFAAGACGRAGLSAFPRVGVRLCLCRHRFPRFLRRHRQYPDFKLECGDHADRQCCRQLPADLRQFRFSGNGDRRRRAGVGDCRSGFRRRFRRLYPVQSQCFPLRA